MRIFGICFGVVALLATSLCLLMLRAFSLDEREEERQNKQEKS